ncbi:MAG: sensor histidine kinase [Clostridia bacterium]|nr:sensor histidine kinase [Clostridia bacterium]
MISLFRRILSNNKIGKKLIVYFMLITLLMGATSLYTYYNSRTLMTKMDTMFTSNVYLNELYDIVNKVETSLENFLSSKHYESLKEYYRYSEILREKSLDMGKENFTQESRLLIKDISNMINTYLNETDAAVLAKRGRNINEYITQYSEASKVYGYINLYINKLNVQQLQENTKRYITESNRLQFVKMLNIAIIFGSILFNIILILWFTLRITRPIVLLSKSANEISKGNFDIASVDVDTGDEISIMAGAFNRMTASLKDYINEIKEKAQLEGRLKEQEMQNLIMKNHLREAEIQALQSQINPHFIFNTLNAGVQIAMLEGADKTSFFIENVAILFRYNMRKLDKPVTLKDEVDNVNSYIFILKTRFADMVEFVQEIDEDALEIEIPRMILQPVVENAFIHGLSSMVTGGSIALRVSKDADAVKIEIEDNGKGMSEETINTIMANSKEFQSPQNAKKTGHTTGIGISNVIIRLKLFYNYEDIVKIYSSPGQGTKVEITIPAKNEDSDMRGDIIV